MNNDQC